MPRLSRRSFLVGAAAAVAGTKSSGRVLGANDAVNLAVVGLNGRGGDHVKEFAVQRGVRVTYLVDPDARVFDKRQKQLEQLGAPAAKTEADIRRVLDDNSVDAVTIATPNHWHALMTVWACQAGKDVYVEKPCSHNLREGRAAVWAARRYDRIVQHGTQRRSWPEYRNLAAVVRSGVYGPLRCSRGLVYKLRLPIGVKPPAAPPAGLDFNLWLGPAAATPYHANLVHYNWHWFWEFGSGDIGNQGVHQMDVARWLIPGATLPKRVVSVGGRFGPPDQGETPNTTVTQFDFGDTQLVFEVRGLPSPNHPGDPKNEGSVLHFDDGYVADFKFHRHGGMACEPVPQVVPEPDPVPGGGNIFANFIAAVRSRNRGNLSADILEGHYSSALCHLGNVSYRLGNDVPFSARAGLPLDGEARATWAATEEHLAKALGTGLDGATLRVGKPLTVDARGEFVTGDGFSDALLTRNYRAPFVMP